MRTEPRAGSFSGPAFPASALSRQRSPSSCEHGRCLASSILRRRTSEIKPRTKLLHWQAGGLPGTRKNRDNSGLKCDHLKETLDRERRLQRKDPLHFYFGFLEKPTSDQCCCQKYM